MNISFFRRRVFCLLQLLLLFPAIAQAQDQAPPPLVPIGLVQGAPASGQDPATFKSPSEGEIVTVQGVIHELFMRYGRRGRVEYGFFLQNTPAASDKDPATSDGIFVYSQRNRQIKLASTGTYVPRIGDEIILSGKIREIMNETHLTVSRVQEILRNQVDIETELQVEPVAFDFDRESAPTFWERHEGMRMSLPAGLVVQQAWHKYGKANDAEYRVILPNSIPAQRTPPYQRRVFRDPHPLDDQPEPLFDNGNPYMVLLSSLGLKGSTHNAKALLETVRTFDTIVEPLVGAVHQRYEHYSILPDTMPVVKAGIDPAGNGREPPLAEKSHFTVATMNLENFFDRRNDPTDPTDDRGDAGNAYVSKPFDYLPFTDEEYQNKLSSFAQQIVGGLHSPDIILLQEVEDQDILVANADRLVPADGEGDGELDVLQELCRTIRISGGPEYRSASDRDAADYRGITTAFLYRTDRVTLADIDAAQPVFGNTFKLPYRGSPAAFNRDVNNPKAINAAMPKDVDLSDGMSGTNVFSRPPQVAMFDVEASVPEGAQRQHLRVYVINNHFSSRPNQRVGQRIEQATVDAILVREILKSDPHACIVLGGDLNVYPRPDDPLPEENSDQLAALYDAGLLNLYDRLLRDRPENAYTYIYQGQAGTLDHLFVSPHLHERLAQVWVAHFNSDWPTGQPDRMPFGATDHDPVHATFSFHP